MPPDHGTPPPRPAPDTAVEAADLALSEQLARHRRHPALRALAGMSQVTDQGPLFGIAGAILGGGWLLGDRRAARAGGRMLLSVLLATAAKSAVKRLVSRTRPHEMLDHGHYEVRPLGPDTGPWHSFPSGHTAGGVAAARALGREYPGGRAALLAGAAANGLVQVPTGAHYATDVAAGAVIGWLSEAAVNRGWAAFGPRARPLREWAPARPEWARRFR